MTEQRPPEEGKRSGLKGLGDFFTSLAGVITGLASLIAAVVSVIVIFQPGSESNDRPSRQVTHPELAPDDRTIPQVALADWRRDANEICESMRIQIGRFGPAQSPEQHLAYATVLRRAVTDLRDVEAPAREEAKITEMINFIEDAASAYQLGGQAIANSDQDTYARARDNLSTASTRGDRRARMLGATRCLSQ